LILQGIRSGGELSDSLDRIADILRERAFVQQEIKAEVQKYVSFIVFAILVGAPLLFGISSFLTEMITELTSNLVLPEAATASGFSPSKLPFEIEFIVRFSVISLIATSIMGALVIGLISSGDWRDGVGFIPVFCVVSVVFFFVVNKVLVSSIGSLM